MNSSNWWQIVLYKLSNSKLSFFRFVKWRFSFRIEDTDNNRRSCSLEQTSENEEEELFPQKFNLPYIEIWHWFSGPAIARRNLILIFRIDPHSTRRYSEPCSLQSKLISNLLIRKNRLADYTGLQNYGHHKGILSSSKQHFVAASWRTKSFVDENI